MSDGSAKAKLDTEIAKMEKRIAYLKAIRSGLDDPDLAGFIPAIFGGEEEGESSERRSQTFDRVVQFFRDRENAWAYSKEIRDATGLDRGAISALIYVQRKDAFERLNGEGPKDVKWRLKEDLFSRNSA
jgi:hypothetical protein